jgi:SAM-dependent methyltransferase
MKLNKKDLWALYEEVAREYNETPLSKTYGFECLCNQEKFDELCAIAEHLPDKDGVFVDLGTGMGIAPRFAKKLGARAITYDAPFAEHTLENAALAGIECHLLDFTQAGLPLEAETADCMLFADVIEHLVSSPRPILQEMHRVLKKGGAVVSSTPNATRLSVRVKIAFGFSNWPVVDDFFYSDHHGGHHHEYTSDEFQRVFRLANFEIEMFRLYGSIGTIAVPSLKLLGSRTRKRSEIGQGLRDHPVITLAKMVVVPLEKMHKPFRPQMLLVAVKPPGTSVVQPG